MKTPILETDRLILKPLTIEDAPAIQKYFNNWNIIRNLSKAVPWPYPEDGAETFLREQVLPKMERGEAMMWGILVKEGPEEIVGVIDYRKDGGEDGNRGFWLAEPFWGHGYMTEAVTAMQDYLFFEMGLEQIIVMNVKENKASRRVKEKTGARFLGVVQLEHHTDSSDTEKWEITRQSWQKFRETAKA